MVALDACNARVGRGTVVPGSIGFAPQRDWSTKFEIRSPRYTTRFDELPVIGGLTRLAGGANSRVWRRAAV